MNGFNHHACTETPPDSLHTAQMSNAIMIQSNINVLGNVPIAISTGQ
ncbi:MAG: hypothetical protein WC089_03660 [Candidatus Paceibacterota bacterium]